MSESKGTTNTTQFQCETKTFLVGLLIGAGIRECTAHVLAREGYIGIERIREDNTIEADEDE